MSVEIRNDKLFCNNCGGEYSFEYPIAISKISEKTKLFTKLHLDCKQTYVEPKVNDSDSVIEKANWWIRNGRIGDSSKTMWNCLIGNKDFKINYPYDPDDFSRCYKLLEAVPEWKKELGRLKILSVQWSNLIDNWDELTKMYELNENQNWENSKEIGMYEFMNKLIN